MADKSSSRASKYCNFCKKGAVCNEVVVRSQRNGGFLFGMAPHVYNSRNVFASLFDDLLPDKDAMMTIARCIIGHDLDTRLVHEFDKHGIGVSVSLQVCVWVLVAVWGSPIRKLALDQSVDLWKETGQEVLLWSGHVVCNKWAKFLSALRAPCHSRRKAV